MYYHNSLHMPPINRNAVFIAGRPPLFEWVNQIMPELKIDPLTDPLEHDNGTIYLTPEFFDTEEAMAWLERNYLYIFEMELWEWSEEEQRWPKNRSWDLFKQWFYISFISMIENTLDEPIVEKWE